LNQRKEDEVPLAIKYPRLQLLRIDLELVETQRCLGQLTAQEIAVSLIVDRRQQMIWAKQEWGHIGICPRLRVLRLNDSVLVSDVLRHHLEWSGF
jgi:hypothetical protein